MHEKFIKEIKVSKKEQEEINKKIEKAKGKLIGKRAKKGTVMKDHTLWEKKEIAVLAYFSKFNNNPSTYREITRAYVSSSYSSYQKACEELARRGYLDKLEGNTYKVSETDWPQVKEGKELMERSLPFFAANLKKLEKRLK